MRFDRINVLLQLELGDMSLSSRHFDTNQGLKAIILISLESRQYSLFLKSVKKRSGNSKLTGKAPRL